MTRSMKLVQYWDEPDPPAEIRGWIDGYRAHNPDFDHRLFDRRSASEFIGQHFGDRHLGAFLSCAVPAMQADYFRLCALLVSGGIYVDADQQSLAPLSGVIGGAPRAMMLVWRNRLINGFLLFREPGDPFLAACLAFATDNIEHRRFMNVYLTSGPAVVNTIWVLATPPGQMQDADAPLSVGPPHPELLARARELICVTPELLQARQDITLTHVLSTAGWLGTSKPTYKQTTRHWENWEGSIYRQAEEAFQAV